MFWKKWWYDHKNLYRAVNHISCTMMWYTALYIAASAQETFKKHIISIICSNKVFMNLWLLFPIHLIFFTSHHSEAARFWKKNEVLLSGKNVYVRDAANIICQSCILFSEMVQIWRWKSTEICFETFLMIISVDWMHSYDHEKCLWTPQERSSMPG